MKRRIFLKITAAGVPYAALRPLPDRWPMESGLTAPQIPAEVEALGFPVMVRPVSNDTPLTGWIETHNNVGQLVIEQIETAPCLITDIESLVGFPDLGDHEYKTSARLTPPVWVFKGEQVTLTFNQAGIVYPDIDDTDEEFRA